MSGAFARPACPCGTGEPYDACCRPLHLGAAAARRGARRAGDVVSGAFARPACPCGTGEPYDACCGPLHLGAARAGSPEQLMRSRYSAFAVGDAAYLLRTWHPRTRPADLDLDPGTTWTGLVVHDSGADHVEFTASWTQDGVAGSLHERSRFEVRGGRWVYVDGEASAG